MKRKKGSISGERIGEKRWDHNARTNNSFPIEHPPFSREFFPKPSGLEATVSVVDQNPTYLSAIEEDKSSTSIIGSAAEYVFSHLPKPIQKGIAVATTSSLLLTGACGDSEPEEYEPTQDPATSTATSESIPPATHTPSPTAISTLDPTQDPSAAVSTLEPIPTATPTSTSIPQTTTPTSSPTTPATQGATTTPPPDTPTAVPTPQFITVEGKYSGFYDFPSDFFENTERYPQSLSPQQIVNIVDAQYQSLKKLHGGKAPLEFMRIQYDPEVFGVTRIYGLDLGDHARPGRNSPEFPYGLTSHEMEHEFLWQKPLFFRLGWPGPYLQESFAALGSFFTYYDAVENQQEYGIDDLSMAVLKKDTEWGIALQKRMHDEYVSGGMEFIPDPYLDDDPDKPETLNNPITTSQAMLYKMILIGNNPEYGGWEKFQDFMKAFDDEMMSILPELMEGEITPEIQTNYTIAALSVAFGKDFRQEFRDLNFPINDSLYDQYRSGINQHISKP